jgi:predicted dehydrogenase
MKVGVIGMGAIAPIHINALLSRGQEIVALCDNEKEKCEKVNEKFSLSSKIYTDYKEMLDNENLDVIHICTPHYLHAEMICEGLKRNVHVLCEKPLAINEKQLEEIENAVKNSKAQLGVCFQNHFNAAVLYVKEYLKDKEITSASANLIWERNAAYYAQGEWRGTWGQEGGGVMINQAIHGLDLLQWLCGMPESVTAYTTNIALKNEIEVEDTAFGLFKLKNGGRMIINATNAASFCFPIYYMFRASGHTVELSADNIIIDGQFITKSDGLPIFGKEVWGVGHVNLIKNFYDCLERNEKFSIDFYEASRVIKMVLAMYRSNGQEIKI